MSHDEPVAQSSPGSTAAPIEPSAAAGGGSPTAAPVRHLGLVMAVYLLGIFMGAIDTGIVTPARTVIQNDLGIGEQLGVWLITIYTLAYAASIPVLGKLADRVGRKPIYLISITLFALGSLLAGLSQSIGSFEFLIFARAVQAIGGGGILPIATAEFGTSVPPERRGLALGLVGGVYGIANIFGASAGSLVLDNFGSHQWPYLFFINLPISVLIVIGGVVFLPNHKAEKVARIDLAGIVVLVSMILALLYGLKDIDFFDLGNSLTSPGVWPYLVGFLLLLPLLIVIERRAADPVLNLRYFTNRALVVTMGLSMLSGVVLMGTVFVPQFAENSLRVASGSGGYFVIILGLTSGIGAPLSGRLTDKYGPRVVLGFGLLMSAVGAAVVMLAAIPHPNLFTVSASLALLGLGLGFTIGSPLNYMMLSHTLPHESNSALATLSLVRSIGTTVAPAILVGFLANAGATLQPALTDLLPKQISAPALPYSQELTDRFAKLKADPDFADQIGSVTFPDLTSQTTIDLDTMGGGDSELPADLEELLRTADVTNITERTKVVARRMYEANTPTVVADITAGVQEGIDSLDGALIDLDAALAEMTDGVGGLDEAVAGITKARSGMQDAIDGMTTGISEMDEGIAGMTEGEAGMKEGIAGMQEGLDEMATALTGMRSGASGIQQAIMGIDALKNNLATIVGSLQFQAAGTSVFDLLPPAQQLALPPNIADLLDGLTAASTSEDVTAAAADLDDYLATLADDLAELQAGISELQAARGELSAQRKALQAELATLQTKLGELKAARADLVAERGSVEEEMQNLAVKLVEANQGRLDLIAARESLLAGRSDLAETARQLTVLRDAVPGAFETALNQYLTEIDALEPELESTFQTTLNRGFWDIYLATALACALGLVALAAYPKRRADED